MTPPTDSAAAARVTEHLGVSRTNVDEPLLVLDDLKTHFQTDRGLVRAVDGVSLTHEARRVARRRRRIRLGQDRPQSLDHGPAAEDRGHVGLGPLRRARGARPARQGHAAPLGRRDVDGLPEPAELAEPADEGRQADHRAAEAPPRHGPHERPRHRGATVARRAHPRGRASPRPVPARVVGRHAPARDDRDRARLRPDDPVRRRADHRPRRHRAGPDPRADRRAAPRPQHVGHPRHPRPRRRRRSHRPDRRDVRRQARRAGPDEDAVREHEDALHPGVDEEHPEAHRREPHTARHDSRSSAGPRPPPAGLPVRAALRVRPRQVSPGGTTARAGRPSRSRVRVLVSRRFAGVPGARRRTRARAGGVAVGIGEAS